MVRGFKDGGAVTLSELYQFHYLTVRYRASENPPNPLFLRGDKAGSNVPTFLKERVVLSPLRKRGLGGFKVWYKDCRPVTRLMHSQIMELVLVRIGTRMRTSIAVLTLIAVLAGAITSASAAEQKSLASFSLVAVGDIMLDRGVGKKIEKQGAGFPFERVSPLLKEADLAFGNLESPISSLGKAVKGKEVTFRAALKVVNGMRDAGIDVVSLGNNHAMDYGPAALMETMDVLAHSGVVYVGAGANSAAARRPANLTVKGVKTSFLAYTYRFHMVVEAQNRKPGAAIATGEQIKADVQKAKEWADVVIVSFHWGWEYSDHPDKETRELAHLTVEAGADLIIGHHPHVIQGVEVYRGGLICYSLGNFIFDQNGRRVTRGLMLRCDIGKSGVKKAEFLPVVIDSAEFRPGLASEKAGKPILLELQRLSRKLETKLELKDNTAIVLKKEAMLIGT